MYIYMYTREHMCIIHNIFPCGHQTVIWSSHIGKTKFHACYAATYNIYNIYSVNIAPFSPVLYAHNNNIELQVWNSEFFGKANGNGRMVGMLSQFEKFAL